MNLTSELDMINIHNPISSKSLTVDFDSKQSPEQIFLFIKFEGKGEYLKTDSLRCAYLNG